jgi:Dolichyl-phosphate-mannose-protein mannosyltransferase
MARLDFRWALLAIVAGGVVLRVLYTLLEAPWPPPALDDQYYFSALPKLIADGEGFVRPFYLAFQGGSLPTAEHPPLHSVVLAGLAKLGGTSPDLQRLTGTVFGAGTIAALGLLGRRLAGERAGLLAAGLAAVYPVLIAADGALMSESLFGLLVAVSLLAAYRLVESASVGRALVLGALVALAALTRSEALLLLPLLLIPVLRRPGGVRAALLAVLAFTVVLTPWTVRNWIVFVQPVIISTNSGSAIAGANCHETYYGDQLGGWRPQCIRETPGNEAKHQDEVRDDGVRYARDHLGRLPLVLAVRLARVWNLYDPLQLPEGRSARAEKLGVLMFFALVPLAVAGTLVLRRRRVPVWILLTPFVVVSFTALLTYGNQRFREPAELSLVVLAAVAIDALLRGRRTARTRAAPA